MDRDFDKWIGKIDLPIEDKDRGRKMNVGKTQANNEVRKALKGMEQEIIDNCIINTIEDTLLDTYYSINLAPDNIIVAPDLDFLLEDFYDIFGKERLRGRHIINE